MTYARPIVNSGNGGPDPGVPANVTRSAPGAAVVLPFPGVALWVDGVEADVLEVPSCDGS
jgi:hypothetical protein